MRVNVGDVVLIKYRTYQDELVNGLFVVCYHESQNIRASEGFTAIKISSKSGCYQIALLKQATDFIDHDSYINCNMTMKFIEDQVIDIIGRVNKHILNSMILQLEQYHKDMQKQLLKLIPEDLQFDKVKKIGENLNENT